MATARELISSSLRLMGVLASGETAEAAQASDGLAALNMLLSAWSVERLNAFAITSDSLVLTIGTGTYTMGSAGTFNTARPIRLISAYVRDGQIDHPVDIIPRESFNAIGYKTTRTIPDQLFVEYSYPLATLKLYPVPDKAYTLFVDSQKALTSLATLDTSLAFPEGYELALKYSLAVHLYPEYGIAAPIEVSSIAVASKANIKRNNAPLPLARLDSMLTHANSQYNIEAG